MAHKRDLNNNWRGNTRGNSQSGQGGRGRGMASGNTQGTNTNNPSIIGTPSSTNNNNDSDSTPRATPATASQPPRAIPQTPHDVPKESVTTYDHLFPASSTTTGTAASTIPNMGTAIAEFNSVPSNAEPFRDIPSVIITTLIRPNLGATEPDWARLLSYFQSNNARRGFANLQDLYLFITRVAIPNLIIQNRRFQRLMFSAQSTLSPRNRLLYQQWGMTPRAAGNPDNYVLQVPNDARIRLEAHSPSTTTRTILRSTPTPDGPQFVAYLSSNPAVEANHVPPQQMNHIVTELDQHLGIPELTLRGLTFEQLTRRTIRALQMFWWLAESNDMLHSFMLKGWKGVETYE